jgi:hypothetical protein
MFIIYLEKHNIYIAFYLFCWEYFWTCIFKFEVHTKINAYYLVPLGEVNNQNVILGVTQAN